MIDRAGRLTSSSRTGAPRGRERRDRARRGLRHPGREQRAPAPGVWVGQPTVTITSLNSFTFSPNVKVAFLFFTATLSV